MVDDALVVAQQVVPEAHPVLGVGLPVGEQAVDERVALGRARVFGEGLQLLGGGRQSVEVEIGAADERGALSGWLHLPAFLFEFGLDKVINGHGSR